MYPQNAKIEPFTEFGGITVEHCGVLALEWKPLQPAEADPRITQDQDTKTTVGIASCEDEKMGTPLGQLCDSHDGQKAFRNLVRSAIRKSGDECPGGGGCSLEDGLECSLPGEGWHPQKDRNRWTSLLRLAVQLRAVPVRATMLRAVFRVCCVLLAGFVACWLHVRVCICLFVHWSVCSSVR